MDTTNYINPNANYFDPGQGGNPTGNIAAPAPSTTFDASSLGAPNSLQLPDTKQPSQYDVSAIPTLADITNQSNSPTQTEKTQTTLSDRLLGAIGKLGGKGQAQSTAETAAGLPGMNQQLTDVNGQIQTLQKEAMSIPLQLQNQVQGKGVTAGGLAPIQAGQLRENSIKALGLSAIAQTLQGNIALAQQHADKAVALQFEPVQNEIDYLREALKMNDAQLTREDKKKADALNIQLNERQRLLDNQKEDKKIVLGYAADAARNGAPSVLLSQVSQINDPQQALSMLSQFMSDPNAKAQALLDLSMKREQLRQSPIAFATDQKLKNAQIGSANASAAKTRAETALLGNDSGGANTIIQDANGNNITVPVNVAPYANISHSGVPYADLSTVQGTAKEKAAIVNQAQAAGFKVITNKNTAADLSNISDANNKLDSISTIMAGLTQPNFIARDLGGLGLTKLAALAQSDPQKAAAGALQSVGLDILKAMSGVQGFRGNSTVVQQINEHMPTIYDTTETANNKIAYIRTLISDRENGILGKSGTNVPAGQTSGNKTVKSNGKDFIIGQVYSDGTGNWTVDASGKWTKQ